jgi:ribosome-associated protein YbcJ (S4-like RNA binding protein)
VTKDGEHENERGTKIVAQMFANILQNWFTIKASQ